MANKRTGKFISQEQEREKLTAPKIGSFLKKYQNFIVIVISLVILVVAIYLYARHSEKVRREKLTLEYGQADTPEKLEALIDKLDDNIKPFAMLKLERLYREQQGKEYEIDSLKRSVAILKKIINEYPETIACTYAKTRLVEVEASLNWLEEGLEKELKKCGTIEERKPKLPLVLEYNKVNFVEGTPKFNLNPLTGAKKPYGPQPTETQ